GRFHQPHDLGDRERRDGAIWRSRNPGTENIVQQGNLHFQLSRRAVRVRLCIQKVLWPHHERVRGRGKKRPGRRSSEGVGGSVRKPEQKPGQGYHVHSSDIPARYRHTLNWSLRSQGRCRPGSRSTGKSLLPIFGIHVKRKIRPNRKYFCFTESKSRLHHTHPAPARVAYHDR